MMTAIADRPVADRPVRKLLSQQLRWVAVLVVGVGLYAAVPLALLGTNNRGYLILGMASFILLMAATWWLHRDRSRHPLASPDGWWTVRAAFIDYLNITLPTPTKSARALSRGDEGSHARVGAAVVGHGRSPAGPAGDPPCD
jgi:hypothetical protein